MDTAELASRLETPLTIIDVGCRGGIDETLAPLLPYARIYGFDADRQECERLTALHGSDRITFVPVALGATQGSASLHITADPACSSLYRPDAAASRAFPALEVTRLERSEALTLDTLDAWAEREGVTDVSLLKLDTQGSELDVLRGATRMIETVWAIKTEVEFNPIYLGQPLFGDVDAFLRSHGFALWRLLNLTHYSKDHGGSRTDRQVFAATPQDVETVEFEAREGRLFWGEAFFVRRELADGFAPADPQQAARAACVLAAIGFCDLASVSAGGDPAASTHPLSVPTTPEGSVARRPLEA